MNLTSERIIELILHFILAVLYFGVWISCGWRLLRTTWGTLFSLGIILLLCAEVAYFVFYVSPYFLSTLGMQRMDQQDISIQLRWFLAFWIKGSRLGMLCILLGIVSLPFFSPSSLERRALTTPLVINSTQRWHPVTFALLLIVTVNLYWLVWLYQTIRVLRDAKISPEWQTPGRSLIYVFVPFVNLFWVLYLICVLPRQIRQLTLTVEPNPETGNFAAALASVIWFLGLISGFLCYVFPQFAVECLFLDLMFFTYTQSHLRATFLALKSEGEWGRGGKPALV